MILKTFLRNHKKHLFIITNIIFGLYLFTACTASPKMPKEPNSGKVEENKPIKKETKEDRKKKMLDTFKALDMEKDTIAFYFEGKPLNLTLPVYVKTNRYYVPLTEMAFNLDGEVSSKDNLANYQLDDKTISINSENDSYNLGSNEYKFRHKPFKSGEVQYVSLFDIAKMMNLKVDWNYKDKAISFFNNVDKITVEPAPKPGRPALVRLEDIATTHYRSEEQLEKLRVVTDFLYSKNVPFNLAWIPRGVSPRENYDMDLTVTYAMENANFLYTMDYMVDKNAVIGLHGYTHQHGSETSGEGTEFSGTVNAGEKETRAIIEKAIDTAKKLDLQYYFFESSHYAATPRQLQIAEEYFDIIYQPRDKYVANTVKRGDKTIRYVPTPLDYLINKNYTNSMLKSVDSLRKDAIGSFFFHPFHEFDFIKLSKNEKGYPVYEYSEEGPLKRLINKMQSSGFKFEKVTSIQ